MRTIDADALLKWLSEWELQEAPWWGANGYGDAKVAETIKEAIDAVEQMPTIEPKLGKWEDVEEVLDEGITDGTPYTVMAVGYKCSECGTEMGYLWSFCPNCGAKMERSEE